VTALLPVATVAVATAPASAAVSWIVEGRGFGHGVGMSQYGAYGYALEGKGYRFILGHYFQGTRVEKLPRSPVVRVLIEIDPDDVLFSSATSACGHSLDPQRTYAAHLGPAQLVLLGPSGRSLGRCEQKLRAAGRGTIEIEGIGPYRGAIEVVPTKSDPGSLNVINAVNVNRYVRGVVPMESPASWPLAALRAQAVAARSYALSSGVDGNGFTLYNDTRSQVYGGLAAETEETNRAVATTRDEVVTYRGRVAQTFFSSTSGGQTESVENSLYGASPVPYLRSVRDPYDFHSPLHTWRLEFTGPEISARLSGYLEGRLRQVEIVERGDSPRIVWARLVGTQGNSMIRGDSLQYALGGYDRWMTFRKIVR
jgi:SpoIID/LytB domain protein